MRYTDKKVEDLKIAYIGGGSRGWAWNLMSDLATCPDMSGDVYLYDIDADAAEDNSIIGNKDCKQTTDDYGYIVIGDDVWYFTGVTSVTSDESNIGFIISNARTGEYKYYPVVG